MLSLALPISVIGGNFTSLWLTYKDGKDKKEPSVPSMHARLNQLEDNMSKHINALEVMLRKFGKYERQIERVMAKLRDKMKAKKEEVDFMSQRMAMRVGRCALRCCNTC